MKPTSFVPPGTGVMALARIPGYDVLEVIGRGALSTVYRVRRAGAAPGEPDYALKVVDAGHAGAQDLVAAFRREAAWLASVGDTRLPVIHEVDEVDGSPYLVMDLIGGTPLSQLLGHGPLSADLTVSLARDVVGPLSAVHRRGLVHRDLKPDNIMVLPTGEARLIDFSLATRDSGEHADHVVGTLLYTPPEQSGMLRRPVDHRCDLYSLGAVLFECLAGTPPFRASDVGELLRQHAVTPAPDLVDLVPGIPVALAALVARLLGKDPDDRHQSGEELAADLDRLVGPAATSSPDRQHSGDARLAGRSRELGLLREQWQQALAGDGRAALVTAAAGTGKTRLAAELARSARQAGRAVLHAKSSPDDPLPIAALRSAFEGYLTELDRLPQDLRDRGREVLVACAGAGAHLLGRLTPSLASLLGAEPARAFAGDGGQGGYDRQEQDQFVVAVVDLLAAMARGCDGLLIVLDDVQWLDPGSAAVIQRLVDRYDDLPLLVLATARDDEPSLAATRSFAGSLGAALALEVELAPLDDEGVGELIEILLPGIGTDQSLTRVVTARAGGNPFVVQEYVRAIVDAGLLRPSWGTWSLDESGLGALGLPQDALGLVLNRVENLGEQVHALLATAAASGMRFRPDVVAAVHGLALEVVQAALVEAAARGLVEPRGTSHFAFVHDRIREALTERQGTQAVPDVHLTIAETLREMPEPVDGYDAEHVYSLARHYLNARLDRPGASPVARSRAFSACWEAGQLALDEYAAADAVLFLQHAALLRPPVHPDSSRFLICLGSALNRDGQQFEAVEVLEQALAVEDDRTTRAEILGLVADAQRSRWAVDEARAAIEQGLAELGVHPSRWAVGQLLSCLPMLVTAHLMAASGYQWRAARAEQRRRFELIAHLHEVGGFVAVIQQKDLDFVSHTVRALYWASRIGSGAVFTRAHGGYGFLLTMIGLRRAPARARARAEADPSMSDPSVRTLIAYYRSAAAVLSYEDNGQQLSGTILEHGRWLDLGAYTDAAHLLCAEAVERGRRTEAAMWHDLVRRRSALHGRTRLTVEFLEAEVLISSGQLARAAVLVERARGQLTPASPVSLAQTANRAEIMLLCEEQEYGPLLERAISAYHDFGLNPRRMLRPGRAPEYLIAMARLAHCRLAGADRTQALVLARAAVAQLGITPRSDVQRAHERVARADLLILEGRAAQALTVLDGMDPVFTPDAPLVVFDACRVRARALLAIGGTEAATRQAALARGIAEDNGWLHRAAWVTAEFPGAESLGGPTSRSAASGLMTGIFGTTGTTGTLSTGWAQARPAEERLRALEQIGATAARVFDPQQLARITLDEAIRILTAERAFLFLADEAGALVPYLGRNSVGDDLTELTGYSASLVQKVHVEGELLVVTGTEQGAALGAQSVVLHGLRSIMVAPLQLDGRQLGVIYLDSQVAKGIFTPEDAGILTALTHHIATSWETARAARLEISVQSAQRQRELAEDLRAALEGMTAALGPQEVMTRLVDSAVTLMGCSGGWVLPPEQAQPLDLTGPAVTGTPDRIPVALTAELSSAASWIALPLGTAETTLGVLVLAAAEDADGRLAAKIDVAAALASQGVTAYERATLFAQVQTLAVQDELTGLANRRHFFEVAERDLSSAARHGRPLCALMVDIDHLKRVNDTYGHPTGDDVIRVVAQRLREQVRTLDVVGRYGGEEFAVVLPDTQSGADTAERLLAGVADTPIPTRSGPLSVTISIGHARATPGLEGLSDLLARADRALYAAKREGRNRAVSD